MHKQIVAIALVAATLAGCNTRSATGSDSGALSATSTDSTAAHVDPVAADPCSGVDRCLEVAHVDVDGDGTLDRVGLSIYQAPPPPQVAFGEATITVLAAVGPNVQRLDVSSPGVLPMAPDGTPQPYIGAYRISRKSGADLVLHTNLGQGNAERFAVIGWQSGRLTPVPRPPEDASSPVSSTWFIGSSHGVHEWVTCTDGASVTMNKLSAPTAEGIPLPGGGIRQEDDFIFDSGSWSPNGSRNVDDSNFSYDFNPHTQTFQCEDQTAR